MVIEASGIRIAGVGASSALVNIIAAHAASNIAGVTFTFKRSRCVLAVGVGVARIGRFVAFIDIVADNPVARVSRRASASERTRRV